MAELLVGRYMVELLVGRCMVELPHDTQKGHNVTMIDCRHVYQRSDRPAALMKLYEMLLPHCHILAV